ncbi:glycine-rich RNA-binding protein 4, mitochondrial isoform X2 [Hevea brasiliensis]|uniref:glycine-rich RNA-binding protein 4, mitochondrial isoform X2 n=1 Tax=Hevea brasiliensis TaxID=3981 RepID=UPI0025D26FA3|nr:glycine-rich RNA-binding protein 4, mitochondrial isoform X2 [Hevea brasiliensis]
MNRTVLSIAKRAAATVQKYFTQGRVFVYVEGLSWSVDEKSLKDAFSSFGDVTEVRIMYDKDSGRSRGFGFVNFSKEDEAICAKDAMDGKALLGRPLRISFALERVRGGPVIVPRLSDSGDDYNRNG